MGKWKVANNLTDDKNSQISANSYLKSVRFLHAFVYLFSCQVTFTNFEHYAQVPF